MIKAQTLYINVDSNSPQAALVLNTSNMKPLDTIGSLVVGDTARYTVYAVDSNGSISSISGDPKYKMNVAIGGLGDPVLARSTNFIASASAWTGSINLNTASLTSVIGTTDIYPTYFEVELIVTGSASDSGSIYTILQSKLNLRNQVIN